MKSLNLIPSVLVILTLTACAHQVPERGTLNDQGLTTYSHRAFEELAIQQPIDFSQYKKIKFEENSIKTPNSFTVCDSNK